MLVEKTQYLYSIQHKSVKFNFNELKSATEKGQHRKSNKLKINPTIKT